MNRRSLKVFASILLLAAALPVVLPLLRPPDPTITFRRRPIDTAKTVPWLPRVDPNDKEAIKAAATAMSEIGVNRNVSQLAFDLGLIDAMPRSFDHRNEKDAADAAAAMGRALQTQKFGDYWSFEVSAEDGRLIAHVKPRFLVLDSPDRQRLMERLASIWRRTKFTVDCGFSKTVEFCGTNGWRETVSPEDE